MDKRHHFVVDTEKRIRACEILWEGIGKSQTDWTMWLDLKKVNPLPTELSLISVGGNDPRLAEVRQKVEVAFGITEHEQLKLLIENYSRKENLLCAKWFIAIYNKRVVGEIGYIPFEYCGQNIARLQNVDILPEFQSKGFGHRLLAECILILKAREFDAACLMAAADNWPKDWYLKFGFKRLNSGETDD